MRPLLSIPVVILVCFVDQSHGSFMNFISNLPVEISRAFSIAWGSMEDAIKQPVQIVRIGTGGTTPKTTRGPQALRAMATTTDHENVDSSNNTDRASITTSDHENVNSSNITNIIEDVLKVTDLILEESPTNTNHNSTNTKDWNSTNTADSVENMNASSYGY